ncbi:hypothetical protein SAMN05892883_2764 [Jatrophihabitans sp. GAS493]|uniref:hypothetical protein n=1 Tax=Jatrophihabitans sp. GAS493 TaxID=1907575 RepID=UPI000BB6FAE4|nr:hypothetical protein [Jatrophihabitans sp. GAS493]SOD73468.1 hypothetical protein SAMN05892883_2764 [Jatrophihabitans sp. GAS493]
MPVPWTEVEQQLNDDGNIASLCDIVVPAADAGDWQRVLDLLREHVIAWEVGYAEDGERTELPKLAQHLVSRSTQANVLISINFAGLPIYGHVFSDDWIEFDVPARDINGQESLDVLAGFVTVLGRAVGKEVRATPEAAHDAPMFVYDASVDAVRMP